MPAITDPIEKARYALQKEIERHIPIRNMCLYELVELLLQEPYKFNKLDSIYWMDIGTNYSLRVSLDDKCWLICYGNKVLYNNMMYITNEKQLEVLRARLTREMEAKDDCK